MFGPSLIVGKAVHGDASGAGVDVVGLVAPVVGATGAVLAPTVGRSDPVDPPVPQAVRSSAATRTGAAARCTWVPPRDSGDGGPWPGPTVVRVRPPDVDGRTGRVGAARVRA